jgi:hypothetical protein
MPAMRVTQDGAGRNWKPTTISFMLGRFRSGSTALKPGVPPVPGPHRSTSGPLAGRFGTVVPIGAFHR